MDTVGTAPSHDEGKFFAGRNIGKRKGWCHAEQVAELIAAVIKLVVGTAGEPFRRDQPLKTARLRTDEGLESAELDRRTLGKGQRRGELGQSRLVIVDSEDELDDRSHRRAGLCLHA